MPDEEHAPVKVPDKPAYSEEHNLHQDVHQELELQDSQGTSAVSLWYSQILK